VKEFDSVLKFAEHLMVLKSEVHHHTRKGLDKALELIQADAEKQIGSYQDEAGPYPAWAPLAESTEADKASHGYPTDAPLLREGDLAKSFQHERHEDEGIVGSTDPVMEYHEFGTIKMPPRPVLGPALFKNKERIQEIMGRAIVEAIVGGEILTGLHSDHFGDDI
jgi:HK97 gp10 family phage protein